MPRKCGRKLAAGCGVLLIEKLPAAAVVLKMVRYFCLICDYDGTIAQDGKVLPSTVSALKRLRESGRKLVLATGRELDDLLQIFPELDIFDRVVAENGGLLYRPAERGKTLLTKPRQQELIDKLKKRGVEPISAGETIVSTWQPNEAATIEAIRELGLDLHVTFNKGAVMILPAGVNKGTGVRAALRELELSEHNAVGIGDAENDHGFLQICECSAAVQNAIEALKTRVDLVTNASRGAGVEELIERLLRDDLADIDERLTRHWLRLGTTANGEPYSITPHGLRLVVSGPSGSGKSTCVSVLIEQLVEKNYQVCVIDPEGDYDDLENFVTVGHAGRKPDLEEISEILETQSSSVTVNLLEIALADRSRFFQKLLAHIQELRSRTGRPHWVITDEAHHMLPESVASEKFDMPIDLPTAVFVTVHPDHITRRVLEEANGMVLVGQDPQRQLAEFNAVSSAKFELESAQLDGLKQGEVIVWLFESRTAPVKVKLDQTKQDRRRHRQKYAAGELGEDKSFYFRGPESKLNLRAQNMNFFAQVAEGIDDATWMFHLRKHDYSHWLRESVKDSDAANEVWEIEQNEQLSPKESRQRVIHAIRERYTAPA